MQVNYSQATGLETKLDLPTIQDVNAFVHRAQLHVVNHNHNATYYEGHQGQYAVVHHHR